MRVLPAFLRLSRPLFLYGGVAGVALGAAFAAAHHVPIDRSGYLGIQVLVTSLQLMVHYANDYFDRHADRYGEPGAWSGGSGVLIAGALPASVARRAAFACGAIGLLATAWFAAVGNATVATLGIAIAACAWAYSAPPLRLCARGLGEIDTVLVVAVLVPLSGYAAFAHGIDPALFRPLAAPIAATLAMILAVELPDAEADRASGKRTLVVRRGVPNTYRALLTLAWCTLALLAAGVRSPADGVAVLPAAIAAALLVREACGRRRPGRTALLGVALSAATATGLAVASALRA